MSLDIYRFSRLKPISRLSKEVNYGQSSHGKHLKKTKKNKHIFSFGYISAKKKGCSMVQVVDKVYLMSVSRGATMQGRFRKDVYVNYLKNTQKYTLIKAR